MQSNLEKIRCRLVTYLNAYFHPKMHNLGRPMIMRVLVLIQDKNMP